MSAPSTITIGMPFFRNRDTLADAIRSVFAQTWQDWHLVLMGDGSDDGSLEIARAVRDSRVHVVSNTTNKGLPTRLNEIVALTSTELLARMDADDMMHPQRLARQIGALRADPTIDVVGTGMYAIDFTGTLVGIMANRPPATDPREVLAKGILGHATILARRSWFERHPYDARYPRAEDRDLWCRTFRTSRFHVVPEPLYFVRTRAGAGTLRKYIASCKDHRALCRVYGPEMAGRLAMVRLIAESYGKEAAYRLATLAGRQDMLLRRRSDSVSERQRVDGEGALGVIRATEVPGLGAP